MSQGDQMKSQIKIVFRPPLVFLISSGLALLIPAELSSAQEKAKTVTPAQKTFATPQLAAAALIQACDSYDVAAMKQILGPRGEDLVSSQDQVQDKNVTLAFAAKAHEQNSISIDPKNANRAMLLVGNDNWPMPIPIIKRNGTWLFDTKAGRDEVLLRRIGSNELDAIEICRNYVEAQLEYAQTKHDGSAVNQYAQRVISTSWKARRSRMAECRWESGRAYLRGLLPMLCNRATRIRLSLITDISSRF